MRFLWGTFFVFSVVNLFTLITCFPFYEDVKSGYENCTTEFKNDKLNVHIVCHTHDDVGWLKTVDQYYYGANQSIQRAGVQYIIDSVVNVLTHDASKTKKFIYVETAFFWRWWNEQSDAMKHAVRALVCDGQLEFIGGGWSMNDEATTHYNSIIDQMTWGLRRLNDTFGPCGRPKVAWQIDPFGHSKEQASIFAQMYYDGLFFGRLDYQDKDERMLTKTMEHLWRGSNSLGLNADLFTGALPNSYSPPSGFCFDLLCNDEPIQDDERLKGYNVDKRVSDFIALAETQSKFYATNHIIMTMGSDFHYQNAAVWYKNLDKLIYHVNKQQNNGSKINVFYSTPSCYLYGLNQANKSWSLKTDDFMPYASDPHAYWTGYFTSRPSMKRYERIGNNILQTCKQLVEMADIDEFDLTLLREAMGIMQHHDAVSGTEKQHVSDDYAETLASAIDACQSSMNEAFSKISNSANSSIPNQYYCNYLNISQCNVSEAEGAFAVTIYNPLAWNIITHVRIPVSGKLYKVFDATGNPVDAQLVDILPDVVKIPGRKSNATSELVFEVNLPPVGYAVYSIKNSSSKAVLKQQTVILQKDSQDYNITNKFYTVFVDGKTGLMKSVRLVEGTNITVNQSFYWYQGMKGHNYDFNDRASGAYIFRPKGAVTISLGTNVSVTVIRGKIVQEIHQVFNSWLSQTIRLYENVENIEFDWIVGPIPVNDSIGKEIITRFDTDLETNSVFHTDANGREMQKRVRNYRKTWTLNITEPVSGNYYPVNSRIYLRDTVKNLQFTVLNDRSQGGSSIQNGSLELMIHRRLLCDDAFGVGEPLNETGVDGRGLVIRGRHFLIISDIPSAASKHRPLAQKIYMEPQLSFFKINSSSPLPSKAYKSSFSAMKNPFPPNVHLLTLEPWKRGTLLIRLEHIYESNEDSPAVDVSLKDCFVTFNITMLNETTLGANQFLTEAKRLKWNSQSSNDIKSILNRQSFQDKALTEDLTVHLQPMQIRTFIATISR